MLEVETIATPKNKSPYLHALAEDLLFSHKRQVSSLFRDVIGLHEIDSLSLYYIDELQRLLAFSYTPAVEFNLFSSHLWQHDLTFSPQFFSKKQQAFWQELYKDERFDELRYLKQLKYNFNIGFSLSKPQQDYHLIYSFATKSNDAQIKSLWLKVSDELSQIGDYCFNHLKPLITDIATNEPTQEFA